MTLEALEVLDAIDHRGSFAAAAESLHRVPSAVTYTVRRLEENLGVTLFDRSGHRAILTPAGRTVLEEGRRILQAAGALEASARRAATGWEPELRIAVDTLVPMSVMLALVEQFYHEQPDIHVRLNSEVQAGAWDALLDERADLVVGAAGDEPAGSGYATRLIGNVEFVFAAAPEHPICQRPQPLARQAIRRFRAVAVADSARSLPTWTTGLLGGQTVLTVPDMHAKIAAQLAGLGVGYVPRCLVEDLLAQGRLVELALEAPRAPVPFFIAWRTPIRGRALQWFVDALDPPDTLRERLGLKD
ncbi:MAG: LysR substrate-binding domain-containing protein [Ectothiorhodospiraceae bacterium]